LTIPIAVAVVLTAAACDPPITSFTIRNDTDKRVVIRDCSDDVCTSGSQQTIDPGQAGGWSGYDQLVKVIDTAGAVLGCVRYQQSADRPPNATANVSRLDPCPT
jgi:hypothetical protein